LGANFKSSRDPLTGREISDLFNLAESEYGPVFHAILENAEQMYEKDYLYHSKNIHEIDQQLQPIKDRIVQIREAGAYDPRAFEEQRALYRRRQYHSAKLMHLNSRLRSNDYLISKMQNEDPFEVALARRVRNESLLEDRGVPIKIANKIRAAQEYYMFKPHAATMPDRYNQAVTRLTTSGLRLHKMPDSLEQFINGLIRTQKDPNNAKAMSDLIHMSGKYSDATTAKRVLEFSRQRTSDFFKLYGLGALPIGTEGTMGQAVLASTGRATGSEIVIQGFTHEGL